MATTTVTITGDMSDAVDQDFDVAQVKLRANTSTITDRDADKIRVLDEGWQAVAADGTYTFPNVIAATDTVVAGTLQYYIDIRARMSDAREWKEVTLGPYDLTRETGTVKVSTLDAAQPTGLARLVSQDVNIDDLTAADAYTDAQIAAHQADPNPHPQYARMVNTLGAAVQGGRLIVAGAGSGFPNAALYPDGTLLAFGGNS